MKSFISNNWRKILIIIGATCLIINLFIKIATPKNLIEDYVKYGKDIEATETVGKVTSLIDKPISTVPAGIVKVTIVFTVAILIAVFISSLGAKSTDKSKKK